MELGRAEGRPERGSTHVVFLSVWLMKKTRPLGATCIVHPDGRPSELGALLAAESPPVAPTDPPTEVLLGTAPPEHGYVLECTIYIPG